MIEKEILQYQSKDGKVPFRDWLMSFNDRTVRARVRTRIARLQLGHFGDCKSVGEGVLELRLHFGSGYRVYFSQAGLAIIILLCAGDKSAQHKDIQLAKAYWADYQRRKKI